jgi:hypothetical protein
MGSPAIAPVTIWIRQFAPGRILSQACTRVPAALPTGPYTAENRSHPPPGGTGQVYVGTVGLSSRCRLQRRCRPSGIWLAQGALLALILEQGYEAVTIQDIIDRADVGRSTFYAHFLDKQQLLLSGFEQLRCDKISLRLVECFEALGFVVGHQAAAPMAHVQLAQAPSRERSCRTLLDVRQTKITFLEASALIIRPNDHSLARSAGRRA